MKRRVLMRTAASYRPTDLVGVTVDEGTASIVLKWPSGRPVVAGEIRAGETVTFIRSTGEVIKIGGSHQPGY
jgi:hypothetical protein